MAHNPTHSRKKRRGKAAPQQPPPKGNPSRCTNAESLKRTAAVYTWVIEGQPSHVIVEKARESWGIGEAQARDYISKAVALLKDEASRRASTTLDDHLNARWHLYKRACETDDVKTAAMIIKDIGRLQALYATERSMLAKANLDSELTQRLADGADVQAADILRKVYDPGE